jgi:hypothetical protein
VERGRWLGRKGKRREKEGGIGSLDAKRVKQEVVVVVVSMSGARQERRSGQGTHACMHTCQNMVWPALLNSMLQGSNGIAKVKG